MKKTEFVPNLRIKVPSLPGTEPSVESAAMFMSRGRVERTKIFHDSPRKSTDEELLKALEDTIREGIKENIAEGTAWLGLSATDPKQGKFDNQVPIFVRAINYQHH